jgi:hypothetical protein
MNTVKTTQEFINGVKDAFENGRNFTQNAGIVGSLVLTVSPDGSAVCRIFGDQVADIPAGSTPNEILVFWSHAVRKFAPAYTVNDSENSIGTTTFVKDLRVGDIILDEHGFIAKVVYVLENDKWDDMHVTTVSHGHSDGKQVKRFLQYPKGSMNTFDLLWAEDGEVVVQEDD